MDNFNIKNWMINENLQREESPQQTEQDFGGIYSGIDFPIEDMESLDAFYKINYLKLVGEPEKRDLPSIAQGETSADSEEMGFAQEIINKMREGKFTDPQATEDILDNLTQEYYG